MKTLFDFFSPSFLFLLIFPSKAQRSNYFCVSHFLISCKTVKPPPPSVRPKVKEKNLQKAKSHKIGPTVPRLATKREKCELETFWLFPKSPRFAHTGQFQQCCSFTKKTPDFAKGKAHQSVHHAYV